MKVLEHIAMLPHQCDTCEDSIKIFSKYYKVISEIRNGVFFILCPKCWEKALESLYKRHQKS